MSELLPPSATPMMHAVVDSVEAMLSGRPLEHAGDPSMVAPEILPYMAWQYGVPVWRDSWPTTVKRAVVMAALLRARRFGTAGSYTRTLEDFGGDVDVQENWDGHHTVRLGIRNVNALRAPLEELRDALGLTGRASVVLTIEATGSAVSTIHVAAAVTKVLVSPLIRSYEEN